MQIGLNSPTNRTLIWINIFIDRHEEQIDEMPRFIDTLPREEDRSRILCNRENISLGVQQVSRQVYSGKYSNSTPRNIPYFP